MEFPRIHGVLPAKNISYNFDVLETCPDDNKQGFSEDDKTFLRIMIEGETVVESCRFSYPLPLTAETGLPDNRDVIYRRTSGTLRDFKKSQEKLDAVIKIMNKDISEGHVQPVVDEEVPSGSSWYLPHFVMTHKRKLTPSLVFGAAAKFQGISLNKLLLSGPDLLAGLRRVLLGFREKRVALSADIKGMFLNFEVAEEHRRFLRFFWWEDNNPNNKLVVYQVNAHAFGLLSSPAVSNFAMLSIANRTSKGVNDIANNALRHSFYVDDLLVSVDTEEEASSLLRELKKRLAGYGLKLLKFASSHRSLLSSEDASVSTDKMKSLPGDHEDQSALGIVCYTTSDVLAPRLNVPDKEFTKRGVLSVICFIFDPMGFISPVLLGGRLFLRNILPKKGYEIDAVKKLNWDDPLPSQMYKNWNDWRNSLQDLVNIKMRRCLQPESVAPVRYDLFIFSDASADAMGYAIYLRTMDAEDNFHLSLVCGNSKLAPPVCNSYNSQAGVECSSSSCTSCCCCQGCSNFRY